jgi:2,4-dienoyl-CoA reductase-like NADH-dependent reductase (Old Yellow Enzyme family)
VTAGLFDPIRLGAITAPNRILLAPMTRGRATRGHVPTEVMATYYAQRASAGVILSEATGISRRAMGWPCAPGIWTQEQVEAWKPITEAVHDAGGRIVVQLWHMGRLVHPSYTDGLPGVSASATTAPGLADTDAGRAPYAEAIALRAADIPGVVDEYALAARHALRAGFDGAQIHAANGYLIDQFLRDGTNLRDDAYGGPPEHRVRLLREVTEAVVAEIGADRTSVRISPNGDAQGVIDSDPERVFVPAARLLAGLGIAFLEARERGPVGTYDGTDQPPVTDALRAAFGGPVVLNGPAVERAEEVVGAGRADAVAVGRAFIANPDLPRRLARGIGLAPDVRETWQSGGAAGYIDYPAAA